MTEANTVHYEWSGMLWCEVMNASVGDYEKYKDADRCPACNGELDL